MDPPLHHCILQHRAAPRRVKNMERKRSLGGKATHSLYGEPLERLPIHFGNHIPKQHLSRLCGRTSRCSLGNDEQA